jgi:NADPH-dependent 2,4-dienoyl-CoA reductase/sulfur reductase-like enzyme
VGIERLQRELRPHVAVIGGGPAGLMAAEIVARGGAAVTVFDRMPSVGRKFLLAGRGGLNLTHSEDLEQFLRRYGAAAQHLQPAIEAFPPAALRGWCEALGQPTFVGSSGRIFPKAMKASPLLRAWLARLRASGVAFKLRHRWKGWDGDGRLIFATPGGETVDSCGRRGARTRRRELAQARLGRELASDPAICGDRSCAAGARQLRVHRPMVGAFRRALSGPAA